MVLIYECTPLCTCSYVLFESFMDSHYRKIVAATKMLSVLTAAHNVHEL